MNDKLLKDKPPPINGLSSSPLLELIIIWWLAHSSLKSSPTETNFTRSTETLPPASSFSWRDSQHHWEFTHLSLRRPCRLTPEDYSRWSLCWPTRTDLSTSGSRVLGVNVRGWPGAGLQTGLNLRCFCLRSSLPIQGAAAKVTPSGTLWITRVLSSGPC